MEKVADSGKWIRNEVRDREAVEGFVSWSEEINVEEPSSHFERQSETEKRATTVTVKLN